MLIDELGVTIAGDRHPKFVKVGDIALEPDPVHKEHRHRNALVLNVPQEGVLEAAGGLLSHGNPLWPQQRGQG